MTAFCLAEGSCRTPQDYVLSLFLNSTVGGSAYSSVEQEMIVWLQTVVYTWSVHRWTVLEARQATWIYASCCLMTRSVLFLCRRWQLAAKGILFPGCLCIHNDIVIVCEHVILQTAWGNFTKFATYVQLG